MDEVGRGALAGPVVACACIFDAKTHKHNGKFRVTGMQDIIIADSKMLTAEAREHSAQWLVSHSSFGIGVVSQELIDTKGILWATQEAMRRALTHLQSKADVTSLLVDGRDHFSFTVPHTSIIRGDSLEPSIAAASILAKVMRDTLMKRAGSVFPLYGFEEHKGYGATTHCDAILEHGPCVIHRKTFLRKLLEGQMSLV